MRYAPNKSIESLGGLRAYLDGTREQHGGNGYDEFVALLEIAMKYKIAERFNVDYSTIYRWVKLYEKEQTKPNRSKK